MSLSTTSRNWRRTQDGKSIELVTEDLPKTLGPKEVLLQIHAMSLNFRDIAMLDGRYPVNVLDRGVPCSDASATVLATGSSVSIFKKNDRVIPSFMQNFVTGNEKRTRPKQLGGDIDGILREYVIYDEQFLTKSPEYLSHDDIATIACAGVSSWIALDLENPMTIAESALMQGTGGVSVFAVVLCVAMGITPIVTSSSDEKLEQVKALGTKKTPVRLTNDGGVDILVNTVGATAMQDSIDVLCQRGGLVSVVGNLGGFPEETGNDWLIAALRKTVTIKTMGVGSTNNQQELCDFLEKHRINLKPLVDSVVEFENAPAAFKYLTSGAHVGKVVIKVS